MFGLYTGIDLTDAAPLAHSPFDGYHRDAARYALELAATAYDFNVQTWLDAGFTDVSMQVETRLFHGLRAVEEDSAFRQQVYNVWTAAMARRMNDASGLMHQARGMARQMMESDSGKAVVMLLNTAPQQYTVAIGFAGTGKRMYDWVPNFRFGHEDGFHAGFQAIAQQFINNADAILFPTAASQLGRERLSLQDILQEMQQVKSPFRIFAAGHSQGAAVMQVWMHRMLANGVLPQHLAGYGFAGPSVCTGEVAAKAPPLPAILISNSDDVFPRMGLTHHLGRQYVYPADESLRSLCYQGRWQEEGFASMMKRLGSIQTTEEALLNVTAFTYALSYLEEEDTRAVLRDTMRLPFVDSAEGTVQTSIRLARRFYRLCYEEAVGQAPDNARLLPLAKQYLLMMRAQGAKQVASTLFQAMHLAHRLVQRDLTAPGMATYTYIAVRGYPQLIEITDESYI